MKIGKSLGILLYIGVESLYREFIKDFLFLRGNILWQFL